MAHRSSRFFYKRLFSSGRQETRETKESFVTFSHQLIGNRTHVSSRHQGGQRGDGMKKEEGKRGVICKNGHQEEKKKEVTDVTDNKKKETSSALHLGTVQYESLGSLWNSFKIFHMLGTRVGQCINIYHLLHINIILLLDCFSIVDYDTLLSVLAT